MLTQIEEELTLFAEAAKKPGVMSLAGQRAEAKCRKQLTAYFKIISARVKLAHLEKLAGLSQEAAKHAAEYKVRQIVRRASDVLHRVLKENYHEAMLAADKQQVVQEADGDIEVGPASGLLSSDAETYAADQAAKQIVGINQTTIDSLSELVASAVGNQMTPADLSSDIRDFLVGMTKNRADMIARTEMADAFGFASLLRLQREDIEYMQLITSPDACQICQDIEDDGPVPVEAGFAGGEYDRSPIHVMCRCATVGARAPEGE